MELDDFQSKAAETIATKDIEILTLGLLGEAGSVATSIKKLKRDNPAADLIKEEVKTELGDVFWYLSAIATHQKMKLSEIAEINLQKTKDLFSKDERDFDESSPENECLPKSGSFEFNADRKSGKLTVTFDGAGFGDPLDDNAYDDDGYRYHDIFHIAYMTILGWSPVIRKQLGKKRKYNSEIDRVEDGARAVFLEEGISVFVFNQNYRDAGVSTFSDRGNIPFTVVSAIKTMTKGLEVGCRSISDWYDAIALGFQCFDAIANAGAGILTFERDKKTICIDV